MARTGFYGWIRDGVRRAVLLGLSDAVEQMGEAESGEVRADLAKVLRPHRTPQGLAEAPSAQAAGRRRLGRGLTATLPPPSAAPQPPQE